MTLSSTSIYVDSDNVIELDALYDIIAAASEDDATVVASLFEYDSIAINAAVAVDKGAGKVGIPSTGHGLVSGDYIRVCHTQNYNGEYTVDATVSTDEIVVTASYVAETFTADAICFKGVPDATNITLAYVAASTGKYQGIFPETVLIVEGDEYYLFIEADDAENNIALFRYKLTGAYLST